MPFSKKRIEKDFKAVKPQPPMHPLPEDYKGGKDDADYEAAYKKYLLEVDAHCVAFDAWKKLCDEAMK